MSQTLEKRVENLEKEFSELRTGVLNMRQPRTDWRRTCGTLEDDEIKEQLRGWLAEMERVKGIEPS